MSVFIWNKKHTPFTSYKFTLWFCSWRAYLQEDKDWLGGEGSCLFCFTNYFFIWLCWVLVVARRVMKIFRHGTQILWLCHSGSVVAACWRSCSVPWEILVPWPGIEPVSPALIARHVLNHRPTGEVPMLLSLNPAISKAPPSEPQKLF